MGTAWGWKNDIGTIDTAFEQPDKMGQLVSNFLASWNPNVVRQAMRATDSYLRDYSVADEGAKGLATRLVTRTGQAALPLAALSQNIFHLVLGWQCFRLCFFLDT